MEKIVLLHTNDLHSHLENWPKIRRFIEQKKRENEKKENTTTITVDLVTLLIAGTRYQKQPMDKQMLN